MASRHSGALRNSQRIGGAQIAPALSLRNYQRAIREFQRNRKACLGAPGIDPVFGADLNVTAEHGLASATLRSSGPSRFGCQIRDRIEEMVYGLSLLAQVDSDVIEKWLWLLRPLFRLDQVILGNVDGGKDHIDVAGKG